MRGSVKRVVIHVEYDDDVAPDKRTVIDRVEVERLAMLLFDRQAIVRYLKGVPDRERALREWDEGEAGGRPPAMMLVYDDASFDVRCSPDSHHVRRY